MKKLNRFISKILVAALIITNIFVIGQDTVFAEKSQSPAAGENDTRIIVKYKDINKKEISKNDVKSALKLEKLDTKKTFDKNRMDLLEISSRDDISRIINELKKDPNVEYAQPDYELRLLDDMVYQDISDFLLIYETGQVIQGQECIPGTAVNVLQAWEITSGSAGVVAGVLDTGMDINHVDLSSNIYTNPGEIPGNGIDDDGNGYIDDVNGWDFANNDSTVYDTPDELHGTHVAGTIAAVNDGEGVCGVVPDVRILPLKFINGDTGYTSDAIEAINYAESFGIKIINCSWGGDIHNQALEDAMGSADILFICASGNDGQPQAAYPAGFNLENVIAVGAINQEGEMASFSNYGDGVDIAAPGVGIISTTPQDGYGISSGTSMAAGFVSGVAALLESYEQGLTPAQMADRIKRNVTQIENLKPYVSSGGIVDAGSVLLNINPGEVSEEPEIEFGEIYGIIESLSTYSNATPEQKEKILIYYGITDASMTACESAGYSLWDSANTSQIMETHNLSTSQIDTLLLQYSSILNLTGELGKYERFKTRYLVSETRYDEMEGYLIGGYTENEIRSAYVASEVTLLEINSLLKVDGEGTLQEVLNSLSMQLTSEEISIMEDFFEEYDIYKTALLTYMEQNSITVSTITQMFDQYEADTLEQYLVESGEMVNPFEEGEPQEIVYESHFNAPYSYRANSTENISINSGSLTFENIDISLPGRNGLDLNIASRYESAGASLYKPDNIISTDYDYRVMKKEKQYVLFYDGTLGEIYYPSAWQEDGRYDTYTTAYNRATQIANTVDYLGICYAISTQSELFTRDHYATYHYYGWSNPYEEYLEIDNPAPSSGQYYINEDGYQGYIPCTYCVKLSDTGYIWGDWVNERKPFDLYREWKWHYEDTLTKDVITPVGDRYRGYEAYIQTYLDYVNYINITHANTYEEIHNNLGSGWSFAFSSIEFDGADKMLHLSNGDVYKINITPVSDDSNLEKYTLNDMRLETDSGSYSNGVKSSSYVLIYKDGKKEYFADDGRLIGIQDRFGNTIKFEHTTINGHPVISKITDTAARITNITYEDTATGKKVTVTAPDNTNVQYILEPIAGYTGEYNLVKKIDRMGRETVFTYGTETGNFSFFSKSYRDKANRFSNLLEIQYPTGATSRYTYQKTTGNLGNKGSLEYFSISAREDVENGQTYNRETYSYSGNYTGYPVHDDQYNLPSSFTYSTTITDMESNKVTSTFNHKHLKTREEVKESGTILTGRLEYEYHSNKLPVKAVNRIYNKSTGQYMETVRNFEYDLQNYGDLIGYWDSQAQRDSNNLPINNEHKTTFTYNSQYHYPTDKTYKKDANTTISEEYIPAASSKSVEWAKTYENDLLKKQTEYIYDTYGNVIQERNYLDDWTNYIASKYSYDDNDAARNGQFDGTYLTRKWVEGIADADGNPVAARAGNGAGTIDEVYKYDING